MVTLKEGDKAPVFTGTDQDGKKISLSDYKGKKLVLYFYSEAGSPTCTIESCNLRDNHGLLKKKGFEVLGVSPDEEKVQKRFEIKYKLPFPLIADTSHDIVEKYGVWDQKKLFGREYMGVLRTTFVIDEKGVIRKIFTRPKNKAHAEDHSAGKVVTASRLPAFSEPASLSGDFTSSPRKKQPSGSM